MIRLALRTLLLRALYAAIRAVPPAPAQRPFSPAEGDSRDDPSTCACCASRATRHVGYRVAPGAYLGAYLCDRHSVATGMEVGRA